jgi:uncharacterized protein YeeX (DUF496 family)
LRGTKHRRIALQKELSHQETSVRGAKLAARKNLGLSNLLWNFQQYMRRKMIATLFTTKIISIIKKMRISDSARFETSYLPTEEISSKKTEETHLFLQKKEFIATLTYIGHNKRTLKSLKLIYIN